MHCNFFLIKLRMWALKPCGVRFFQVPQDNGLTFGTCGCPTYSWIHLFANAFMHQKYHDLREKDTFLPSSIQSLVYQSLEEYGFNAREPNQCPSRGSFCEHGCSGIRICVQLGLLWPSFPVCLCSLSLNMATANSFPSIALGLICTQLSQY